MGKTSIEWANYSWNYFVGCDVYSPGCKNCYAMTQAHRIKRMEEGRTGDPSTTHYFGTTKIVNEKPVWTGLLKLAPDHIQLQPINWKKPRKIFVNSMSDIFHESAPVDWIDRAFAIMAVSGRHTFQVLTKRSQRMQRYMNDPATPSRIARKAVDLWVDKSVDGAAMVKAGTWPVISKGGSAYLPENLKLAEWPLKNVWLGVSVEDQTRADQRIPDLLQSPAVVRWVSIEPMLGAINLNSIDIAAYLRSYKPGSDIGLHEFDPIMKFPLLTPFYHLGSGASYPGLDWIVVGGESGRGARPIHPDWVREIRDQCAVAGVAFLFKQWGGWVSILDRDKDDPDWRADYSGFERKGRRWLNYDGGMGFHGDRLHVMRKASKKTAGRTLDGKIHDAYPEAHK